MITMIWATTTASYHELTKLNKKLLKLSGMVEERVPKATQVIESKDQDAIHDIIVSDYQVDEREVKIEEYFLKILTLHQPLASDLRFLIGVIKKLITKWNVLRIWR